LLNALELLNQAIKRDENFVSAYCYAARANALLYFFDLDPTQDRILLAETAVNAARAFAPTPPRLISPRPIFCSDAIVITTARWQNSRSRRPGLPNNTPFFILSGYINRRRNHWPEAERDFSTAVALDPRNPTLTICWPIRTDCKGAFLKWCRLTSVLLPRVNRRRLFNSGSI